MFFTVSHVDNVKSYFQDTYVGHS